MCDNSPQNSEASGADSPGSVRPCGNHRAGQVGTEIAHDLRQRLFDQVQRHLAAKGLKVATGTIVDATIITAPSSTKNADKARDPEMRQTKKGNQWYFGMKAHFGVDSRTKLIHAAVATPANVADSTVFPELLHGNETRVWGDQAYRGQRLVIRQHAPKAREF